MKKLPDYLRRAHKLSVKAGWTWDHRAGSGHVVVRDAGGEFVVAVSLTAYDGTLTRKTAGKLRRAGCPGL